METSIPKDDNLNVINQSVSINEELSNNIKVKPNTSSDDTHHWTILSLSALFLLGFIWGSAFSFIKTALDPKHGFPFLAMVMLRLWSGGLSMLLLLLFMCIIRKSFRQQIFTHLQRFPVIIHLIMMGTFNNVIPFCLVGLAEGPLDVNVGVASILDSTIPLFAIPIGHFFLPEKLNALKIVGLAIGFGGVVLVCLKSVNIGGHEPFRVYDLWGYIMVTLASASYGVASVYARRYLKTVPGFLCATGQILSGAIITTILSLIFEMGLSHDHYGFWKRASVFSWLSIAYLGICSTFVAYILYFYLVNTVGSGKQSMVGYLLPVFGVFEGALFFGDWVGVAWYYILFELLGAFFIIFGIAITSFNIKQTGKRFGLCLFFVSTKSTKSVRKGYGEVDSDDDEILGGTPAENDKLLASTV